MESFSAGVSHVTHLYNAMSAFSQRTPNVVGAALDAPVTCELIADNIHSHPAAQRLAACAKGERLLLITDSMRACALGDGKSELGGQEVFVTGNRAVLADGTIAGSVLSMNRAVKIFAENVGISIPKAVMHASRIPAEVLSRYDERGSIEVGKRADFAIFDNNIQISATIVLGNLVYRAGNECQA